MSFFIESDEVESLKIVSKFQGNFTLVNRLVYRELPLCVTELVVANSVQVKQIHL